MKTKTYLFALMAMALALGSCSDNENGIGGETSKYITVSTSIGRPGEGDSQGCAQWSPVDGNPRPQCAPYLGVYHADSSFQAVCC